jgi:hypothetical protein
MRGLAVGLLCLVVGCGPSQFEKEQAAQEKEFIAIAKDCLAQAESDVDGVQRFAQIPDLAWKYARKGAKHLRDEMDKAPNIRRNPKLKLVRDAILLMASGFELVDGSVMKDSLAEAIERLDKHLDFIKETLKTAN